MKLWNNLLPSYKASKLDCQIFSGREAPALSFNVEICSSQWNFFNELEGKSSKKQAIEPMERPVPLNYGEEVYPRLAWSF